MPFGTACGTGNEICGGDGECGLPNGDICDDNDECASGDDEPSGPAESSAN